MVLKTSTIPRHTEEVLDAKDRDEIHRIIADLRQTYIERHTEALSAYHQAERQANRALHEVNRVEKHLERIKDFCQKNNIPLEEEK